MSDLLDDPTLADIRLKKPMPRVLAKKLKRASIEKHRVDIKARVFKRDGGRCRCCGAAATELHELKTRGAGGKRSLFNSIAVCGFAANHCHRMIQTRVIEARCLSASFGADSTIEFTMGPRVWHSTPSLMVGGE